MNKLDYVIIALLTIGSVPFGALLIVPVFYVWISKSNKAVYSTLSLMIYSVVSIALLSFNILIFLAILLTFLFSRVRSFWFAGGVFAVCIFSAFVPVPSDYILISAFIIGLALLGLSENDMKTNLMGGREKGNGEIKDPLLEKYERLEKELGFK